MKSREQTMTSHPTQTFLCVGSGAMSSRTPAVGVSGWGVGMGYVASLPLFASVHELFASGILEQKETK